MGDTASSVTGILDELQPLISLAAMCFDKPEISEPITRVVIQPSVNMACSDTHTQSMPLTLYKSSYLSTAQSYVPDGGPWTWADIAMRPALHAVALMSNSFTQTSLPIIATGTPLHWAICCHEFWRSSVRFSLKFYCSSFTAGRFLLVFVPPGQTSADDINGTVSKNIYIKGDTSVEFTIPYIAPTDFLPTVGISDLPNSSGFIGFGRLDLSLYSPIVTTDASQTPIIQVVIWSAAAPDCQFSMPFCGTNFTYTNFSGTDIVQQCNIVEEFQATFPPFVSGCAYLTDDHYVQSELVNRPLDVCKRFQNSSTITTSDGANLGLDYAPVADTLGWQISSAFLFRRGGMMYKMVPFANKMDPDPSTGYQIAYWESQNAATKSVQIAYGQPCIAQSTSEMTLDVAMPWICPYPYCFFNSPTLGTGDFTTEQHINYTPPPATTSTHVVNIFTAVRDDFEFGYLIPPIPLTAAIKVKSNSSREYVPSQKISELAARQQKSSTVSGALNRAFPPFSKPIDFD